MFSEQFYNSDLFHWAVMPLLIYLCRVSDVTLGTLRNLFLSKNLKQIVPVVGFFEVMIWLVAVSQVLKHMDNFMCYAGWGLGYATGIIIGIKIDERLGLGLQMLRIITNKDCDELVEALNKEDLGATVIDGKGAKGPIKMVYLIIKRTDFKKVSTYIQLHNPDAFYTIEDVKEARRGVFPMAGGNQTMFYLRRLLPLANR
ncbi:MAG: DUF5698 domain-containing protein [Bacteroidia bacterium]